MPDVTSLHNALGGNSADQLRAYVVRIEHLEEDIDGLNCSKQDTYREAKAAGFCKKTMRKVILRRRKERSDVQEEDALQELYEAALASVAPTT